MLYAHASKVSAISNKDFMDLLMKNDDITRSSWKYGCTSKFIKLGYFYLRLNVILVILITISSLPISTMLWKAKWFKHCSLCPKKMCGCGMAQLNQINLNKQKSDYNK